MSEVFYECRSRVNLFSSLNSTNRLARPTNFVFFGKNICLVHEDLEVYIGVILVGRDGKIHELLDWLMIQILQVKPSDTSARFQRIGELRI